jgi:hypothetical protein
MILDELGRYCVGPARLATITDTSSATAFRFLGGRL